MVSFRPGASRLRLIVASLATLVVAALLTAGTPVPAQAAAPATIAVKITNRAGAVLSGLDFVAVQPVAGHLESGAAIEASPCQTGYYCASVDTGTSYAVYVGASSGTYSQWYGGTDSFDGATLITPTADQTSYVDFSLDGNVAITGKVVNTSKKAIPGIQVTAYRFDGTSWWDWDTVAAASTGVYTLKDLDPGSYKLEFDDYSTAGYLQSFSGGATTLDAASSIYVSAGTSTVNATLGVGGKITGKATYTYAGKATAANLIYPVAYPVLSNNTIDKSRPYYGADTGTTGQWTVVGMPTGTYIVKLYDDSAPGDYSLTSAYVGASGPVASANTASRFAVTSGKTTTKSGTTLLGLVDNDSTSDFTLTVDDSASDPVDGADVTLTSADNNDFSYTSNPDDSSTETVDGQLTIPRLASGLYTLAVDADAYQPYSETFTYDSASPAKVVQLSARTALGWQDGAVPFVDTSGTPPDLEVGAPHTVTAVSNLSGVVPTYEWLRNGKPIYGATGAHYTAQNGDLTSALSVLVTEAANGFDPVSYEVPVGTIITGPKVQADGAAPAITTAGPVAQGTVLTASDGSWDVAGVTRTITWFGSTDSFAHRTQLGTGASYTTKPTDADSDIEAEVVASKAPGYVPSDPVDTASVHVTKAAAPHVTASPKLTVGKKASNGSVTYKVTSGTWLPSGFAFSYAWKLDGATVGTSTSYARAKAYAARELEVTITTVPRVGYPQASTTVLAAKSTEKPTVGTAPQVVTSPSLTPVTSATQQLPYTTKLDATQHGPSWSYPDAAQTGKTTYQWYRQSGTKKAVKISRATAGTYTTTTSDIGMKVSVIETSSNSHYAAAAAAVPAGTIVTNTALLGTPFTVTTTGPGVAGTTLTSATSSGWPVSGVTTTRQWLLCVPSVTNLCDQPSNTRQYAKISKATAVSYATLATQKNDYIAVELTGTKAGYSTSHVFSAGTQLTVPVIATLTAPSASAGLTSGSAHVGVKLTGKAGTYDVASLTHKYQWKSCDTGVSDCSSPLNWLAISKATATTYTPTATDYATGHRQIEFVDTVSKSGFAAIVNPSPAYAIGLGTPTITKAPAIKAATSTYTVSAGTASSGGAASYQWFVNASPASPANTTSIWHRNASADVNKYIHVVVTYAARGAYAARTVSLVAQKGHAPTTTGIHITGTSYGTPLSIADPFNYGTYGDPATAHTLSYQWYISGKAVKGATKSSYSVPVGDIKKTVTVKVGATSTGYNTGAYTAPTITFASGPARAGTAVVTANTTDVRPGTTLKAVPTGFPSGMAYSYQWQSQIGSGSFLTINGGTKSSFVVTTGYPGRHIRVVITAKKTGYVSATPASTPVPVLYSLDLAPVSSPVITGTGRVDAVMTATLGTWNATGLAATYKWMRNGVAIPGATASTYTPRGESYGDDISVLVTVSKAGYLTGSDTSNAVTVIKGVAPLATTLPKITGTSAIGSMLTASTGTWGVAGLGFSYQWYLGSTPVASGTSTYTPTAIGTYTVKVIATRHGYTDSATTPSSNSVVITH